DLSKSLETVASVRSQIPKLVSDARALEEQDLYADTGTNGNIFYDKASNKLTLIDFDNLPPLNPLMEDERISGVAELMDGLLGGRAFNYKPERVSKHDVENMKLILDELQKSGVEHPDPLANRLLMKLFSAVEARQ